MYGQPQVIDSPITGLFAQTTFRYFQEQARIKTLIIILGYDQDLVQQFWSHFWIMSLQRINKPYGSLIAGVAAKEWFHMIPTLVTLNSTAVWGLDKSRLDMITTAISLEAMTSQAVTSGRCVFTPAWWLVGGLAPSLYPKIGDDNHPTGIQWNEPRDSRSSAVRQLTFVRSKCFKSSTLSTGFMGHVRSTAATNPSNPDGSFVH